MLFSFFSEDYYFRQREIGQAADFTPSKIIDLDCIPLAFIGICRTFVVALYERAIPMWNDGNIEPTKKHRKEEKYPLQPFFEC